MNWVLVIVLVTKFGVTEVQGEFETLQKCADAQEIMLLTTPIDENFISLTTECQPIPDKGVKT
jgi:hypothetical protein